MLKHIVIFLALLTCTATHAELFEGQLPIICGTTVEIFTSLRDQFAETPTWLGYSDSDTSYIAVFSNRFTSAWTLVKFNQEFACVLGAGPNSRQILGDLI